MNLAIDPWALGLIMGGMLRLTIAIIQYINEIASQEEITKRDLERIAHDLTAYTYAIGFGKKEILECFLPQTTTPENEELVKEGLEELKEAIDHFGAAWGGQTNLTDILKN